jgi:AraC family transcriptional activator of pobA
VERFRRLLERDHAKEHAVSAYARAVGLTPGHLNALCRRALGRTAGACIRERLGLEARRLLLYTDLRAAEVATRLGFADPAYFSRFFRRECGTSPSAFRDAAASGPEARRPGASRAAVTRSGSDTRRRLQPSAQPRRT